MGTNIENPQPHTWEATWRGSGARNTGKHSLLVSATKYVIKKTFFGESPKHSEIQVFAHYLEFAVTQLPTHPNLITEPSAIVKRFVFLTLGKAGHEGTSEKYVVLWRRLGWRGLVPFRRTTKETVLACRKN